MKYELHPLHPISAPVGDRIRRAGRRHRSDGLRADRMQHDGMIIDRKPRCRVLFRRRRAAPMLSSPATTRVVCAVRQPASAAPFLDRLAAIVASAQDGRRRSRRTTAKARHAAVPYQPLRRGRHSLAPANASSNGRQRWPKADPELAKQVAHGEVSLPAAVAKVEGRKIANAETKPVMVSEERAAELLAENAELRERTRDRAGRAGGIEDNSQMAAIFEADDRLAAAMAEIKRLKAEVASLKEQLAGAIGTRNEAIRSAKYYKSKCEKVAA